MTIITPIRVPVSHLRSTQQASSTRRARAVLLCAVCLVVVACSPQPTEAVRTGSNARVTLPNGATLSYVESGDRTGEPVVLLHGYTDSAASFAPLVASLPDELRIIALEQRGHGQSSRGLASYTMADSTADVVGFLDAMQLERVTLVGHSMGSLIAQRVAIEHPTRVDRLVLIGAAANCNTAETQAFLDEVRRLVDPIDPAFVREFQYSTLALPAPDEFMEDAVAASLTVPAHVWRQALESLMQEDTTPSLAKISAATLIVWGDRDALFPRGQQDILDRLIPDSTLRILPGVGHAPHWEQPQRVAELIAAFSSESNARR